MTLDQQIGSARNDESRNTVTRPELSLVRQLCKELEAEHVNYCHWKSNAMLHRSATGENDLDLLVSRAEAEVFTSILYRLGFKQAFAPAERQLPGVLDFYGYDIEADMMVHAHVHYQLVFGDDMTKNYRLPIEQPFLESAIQDHWFRIPAPEFEFIVFVIRMVLKYSTLNGLLARRGVLPKTAQVEFEYLQSHIDRAQVDKILAQHLPFLEAALFNGCVQSLQPGYSLAARIRVGQQLHRALDACARRPRILDAPLKVWRRARGKIRQFMFGHRPGRRLATGGVILAVVGGDGAGKSTAIQELSAWLSKYFGTAAIHMGKPPQSGATFAVRGASLVGEWLGALLRRKWSVKSAEHIKSSVVARYLWLLRRVCIAGDRYRAYVKARRFASNGGVVICDRYPVPQITLMDGPQLDQMVDPLKSNRLMKFLALREKKYYQQIMPPDLLVVLRVNPEIAVQRKPTENEVTVEARAREIWELDWRGVRAHVIDASQPREKVLLDAKSLIWAGL